MSLGQGLSTFRVQPGQPSPASTRRQSTAQRSTAHQRTAPQRTAQQPPLVSSSFPLHKSDGDAVCLRSVQHPKRRRCHISRYSTGPETKPLHPILASIRATEQYWPFHPLRLLALPSSPAAAATDAVSFHIWGLNFFFPVSPLCWLSLVRVPALHQPIYQAKPSLLSTATHNLPASSYHCIASSPWSLRLRPNSFLGSFRIQLDRLSALVTVLFSCTWGACRSAAVIQRPCAVTLRNGRRHVH
jgi:hypothetical protein